MHYVLLACLSLALSSCAVLSNLDNVKRYRVTGVPGIFVVAPAPGILAIGSSQPLEVLASSGQCEFVTTLDGEKLAVECQLDKALAADYLCRIPEAVRGERGCILNYSVHVNTKGRITATYEP